MLRHNNIYIFILWLILILSMRLLPIPKLSRNMFEKKRGSSYKIQYFIHSCHFSTAIQLHSKTKSSSLVVSCQLETGPPGAAAGSVCSFLCGQWSGIRLWTHHWDVLYCKGCWVAWENNSRFTHSVKLPIWVTRWAWATIVMFGNSVLRLNRMSFVISYAFSYLLFKCSKRVSKSPKKYIL